MALTKNVRIAVVFVVAVVVVAAGVSLLRRGYGDVKTNVVLKNGKVQCVVEKSDVTIKKDKKLSWIIDNQCRNKNELVTVGNFRMAKASSATDCLQPTEGSGVTWPFQEDIDDRSKRQGTDRITLKIKKDSDLPGDRLTYYFDICTGLNAEWKSDPLLVIER